MRKGLDYRKTLTLDEGVSKRLIIGGLIAAVIAIGIIIGVVMHNSGKKETGSNGIQVITDGIEVNGLGKNGDINNVSAGSEGSDTSDAELEIMKDENPDVDANGSTYSESGKGSSTGSSSDASSNVQVVNPVVPNTSNTGSDIQNSNEGNSGNGNNSNAESDADSGSGSENGGGSGSSSSSTTTDIIIEDKEEESEVIPGASYDASEGRSFETERIPVD